MSTLTTEQPETSPSVDTDCSALLPDSMRETAKHIRRVQQLLNDVVTRLIDRAMRHDTTKLHEPEASTFAVMTAKLKGRTYGSEEYKGFLAAMKPALDHHYEHNSHHPEHWRGGIKDMSLLDLIEMLVDWKAAGERHADGSIAKSLDHNKGRFGYGDELDAILRRTAAELWPSDWGDWTTVTEQAWYWWWDQDPDGGPVPVSILHSGSDGKYFASVGQLGWNRPQNVEEMGGRWLLMTEPEVTRD